MGFTTHLRTRYILVLGTSGSGAGGEPGRREREPQHPFKAMKAPLPDLSEKWPERLERVRRSQERTDTRGMTRPPRDPVEREFLRRIGREGPFVESSSANEGDGKPPASPLNDAEAPEGGAARRKV
jgi:hypothetical protein